MNLTDDTVQGYFDSPLGAMVVAIAQDQLVGLWFADAAHRPKLSTCPVVANLPLLQQVRNQIAEYFTGQRTAFDLPLNLNTGTTFQNTVWQALSTITHGRTLSYAVLANQIGKPRAVRALAAAIGRNPISIIVPCHRVVGADGSLTGYAGGLQRKAALLQLEGAL